MRSTRQPARNLDLTRYQYAPGALARLPAFSPMPDYPLRLLHALANMLIERFDHSARGMSYALVARKNPSANR